MTKRLKAPTQDGRYGARSINQIMDRADELVTVSTPHKHIWKGA